MRKRFLVIVVLLLGFLSACTGDKTIKVTFVSNGGNDIAEQTIKTTDSNITLPEPTRTGFDFGGWFTDELLSKPFSIADLLSNTGGLTLYAKWLPLASSHTITFNTNGGSEIATLTYEANETIVAPTAPTKTGHTFQGWYIDALLETAYTFSKMPNNDLVLYAKWTVNDYTITYNVNGGTAIDVTTHAYASVITEPTDPTKAGYDFGGWYADELLTTAYVFTSMPANNVNLYAKWTPKNFSLSFVTNGGTEITSVSYAYGSTITAPTAPTKDGFDFVGWYSDELLTTAYVFQTMPANNVILYAKWTPKTYTITYNTNGGSEVAMASYTFGQATAAPANPTKDGFTFVNWYSDQTLETAFSFTTMPSRNVVLYAKWEPITYDFIFETNGGNAIATLKLTYNQVIPTLTTPTKDGYKFEGWFVDSTLETAFALTNMPMDTVRVYAKWSPNTYSITIDLETDVVIDVVFGASITLPEPVIPAGYTFEGYFEGDVAFILTSMPARNIIIVPKFEAISYKITFVGVTLDPINVQYGELIELTAPIQEGYTFKGWFYDNQYEVAVGNDPMPARDITVYAKFEINSYTLTLSVDGVTSEQTVEYLETYQPTIPTKEGFKFEGWYLEPTFDTKVNSYVMPSADLIIYAHFVIDDGYVNFDVMLLMPRLTSVKVKGIVTYVFPDKSGYYLSDGDIAIVVSSVNGLVEVGDTLEVSGTFDFIFDIPTIVDVTDEQEVSETILIPEATPIELIDFREFNSYEVLIYTIKYSTLAFIYSDGYDYFLTDMMDDIALVVSPISYPNKDMEPYLGKYVQIEFYIESIDHEYEEYVVRIDIDSYEEIVLTDEEKINLVLQSGDMLNEMNFYAGMIIELPTYDPYFNVELSFETIGDNKDYFNVETGEFLETDVDRVIELRCTVTLNETTVQKTFYINLKTELVVTPSTLSNVPDETFVTLRGFVYFYEEEASLGIIMDEYGVVPIMIMKDLTFGDIIEISGYKFTQDGIVVLFTSDDSMPKVISSDNPMPQISEIITIQEFLEIELMSEWFKYVNITGVVGSMGSDGWYGICNVDGCVPLINPAAEANLMLSLFVGNEITISGLIFPSHLGLSLLFTANQAEISVTLKDENVIDMISNHLQTVYHFNHYEKGDIVELITSYPLIPGAEIVYQAVDPTLIDITTGQISDEIGFTTEIELFVTINYKTYSETISIALNIFVKLEPTTIYSILQDEQIYLRQFTGVVVDYNDKGMVLIADETGTVLVYSNSYLSIGDIVTVEGYLEALHTPRVINQNYDPVVSYDGYGNVPDEITMSIETFLNADLSQYGTGYLNLNIRGTLLYDELISDYYLSDGTNRLSVNINHADYVGMIDDYVSYEVILHGHAVVNPEGNMFMIMNAFRDIEIPKSIESQMDEVADEATQYLPTFFMPGNLFEPVVATFDGLTYEIVAIGENALYYDAVTHIIQLDTPNETLIEFKLVLTYEDIIQEYPFEVFIVNKAISTIEEILLGEEGDSFFTEVIVVGNSYQSYYTIIADETGFMMLEGFLGFGQGTKLSLYGSLVLVGETPILSVPYYGIELSYGHDNPLTATPISINDFNAFTTTEPFDYRYVEVSGVIRFDEMNYSYVIESPDGLNHVRVDQFGAHVLSWYQNIKVKVRGFMVYDELDGNILLFSGDTYSVLLGYADEAEMVDEIVAQGTYYYSQTFRPYQQIDFPDSYPIFDATLEFTLLSGADLLDIDNNVVELEQPGTIELSVVITINDYSRTETFTIHVEPYNLTRIVDLIHYGQQDYVYVEGLVVEASNYDEYIIMDDSGYVLLNTYYKLEIGDFIEVIASVDNYNSRITLRSDFEKPLINIVSSDNQIINNPVSTTIEELQPLLKEDVIPMTYVTLTGTVTFNYANYMITDGTYSIMLISDEYLFPYHGQNVTIKGYISGVENYIEPVIILIVPSGEDNIVVAELSDEQKLTIIQEYAINQFNQVFLGALSYELESTHPVYGGEFSVDFSEASDIFTYDGYNLYISDVLVQTTYELDMTISFENLSVVVPIMITVNPMNIISIGEIIEMLELQSEVEGVAISGVIIGIDYNFDGIVYVYDGTGIVQYFEFEVDASTMIGHEVTLFGSVGNMYGDVYGFYNTEYLKVGNYVGINETATVIDLDALIVDGEYMSEYTHAYVETTGTIVNDQGIIYLSINSGADTIEIISNQSPKFQELQVTGTEVTVQGFILGQVGSSPDGYPHVCLIVYEEALPVL